jgi:hypothetical protein
MDRHTHSAQFEWLEVAGERGGGDAGRRTSSSRSCGDLAGATPAVGARSCGNSGGRIELRRGVASSKRIGFVPGRRLREPTRPTAGLSRSFGSGARMRITSTVDAPVLMATAAALLWNGRNDPVVSRRAGACDRLQRHARVFASLLFAGQQILNRDPLKGPLVCFRSRRGNLLKVICRMSGAPACSKRAGPLLVAEPDGRHGGDLANTTREPTVRDRLATTPGYVAADAYPTTRPPPPPPKNPALFSTTVWRQHSRPSAGRSVNFFSPNRVELVTLH